MIRSLLMFLTIVLWTGAAGAQAPFCDDLEGEQSLLAERLLATEYLYDCCDGTIASCLDEKPTCALAARLADNVCRRVAEGQDEVRIRRALSRRARSMVGGGAPADIDLSEAPAVGPDDAPVTVVVYACARCPYCSELVPALYEEVTAGVLRNDVRLAFRVFPIRGHEGSTPAGLGFVAAAEMGAFWPFLNRAYGEFDAFSEERQVDWAAEAGLDRESFTARIADPATREELVESKKEGLVNGVEETPTVFINGRRWVGDLGLAELVDAMAEEVERVRGKRWVSNAE